MCHSRGSARAAFCNNKQYEKWRVAAKKPTSPTRSESPLMNIFFAVFCCFVYVSDCVTIKKKATYNKNRVESQSNALSKSARVPFTSTTVWSSLFFLPCLHREEQDKRAEKRIACIDECEICWSMCANNKVWDFSMKHSCNFSEKFPSPHIWHTPSRAHRVWECKTL